MQDNKKKTASDNSRTIAIITSVVIALILWSYVMLVENPTSQTPITRVPVQLLNQQTLTAKGLAIAGDGEYTVDVIVEGRRADIGNLSHEDITAEVDLVGWGKGENYIPVNVKHPPNIEIIEVRSSRILVVVEDLVALTKPIHVVYRGSFPQSTEGEEVELRPAEIEITGAKSLVESVHEVRVYIDVEDLSEEAVTIQSEATPLDNQEMIVENVNLSSSYVNVTARLLRLKEVALEVETTGSLGDGLGVEIDAPQTVLIKGTRSALADIETVRAEPIDISGMNEGGNVTLNLLLPDGVALSKQNPRVTAVVSIQETSTKLFQFTIDDIVLEGLTPGRAVNAEEVDISVTVTGRAEIVDPLQQNQLRLYIEVADLAAGSHIVPVMVSTEASLHNIIVSPPELSITVEDTEQEDGNE